jgi:hypothetical protein
MLMAARTLFRMLSHAAAALQQAVRTLRAQEESSRSPWVTWMHAVMGGMRRLLLASLQRSQALSRTAAAEWRYS